MSDANRIGRGWSQDWPFFVEAMPGEVCGVELFVVFRHDVIMMNKVARNSPTGEFSRDVELGKWLDRSMLAAAAGLDQSLSVKEFEAAWSPRFATAEIEELVIPRRTMARRKATDTMLAPEEVDRALRLARIQTKADRVFGEAERASLWLRSPNKRLSGQSPLQVLKHEAGAMLIEEMLVQIDHGIYV